MAQKTIDRNNLLLSGKFEEQFGDVVVMKADDGFVISVPFEEGMVSWFHIDKSDAERFAQAVLVHSGMVEIK